jgi:hypothetical protein
MLTPEAKHHRKGNHFPIKFKKSRKANQLSRQQINVYLHLTKKITKDPLLSPTKMFKN